MRYVRTLYNIKINIKEKMEKCFLETPNLAERLLRGKKALCAILNTGVRSLSPVRITMNHTTI
jgi:hypothetical protein